MAQVQPEVATSAGDDDRGKLSGLADGGSGSQETALVLHPDLRRSTSRFRCSFFFAGLAFLFTPFVSLWNFESPVDPTNYAERARRVLKSTPLIDGHNDFPWLLRIELHNRLYNGKADPEKRLLGHTDLLRMREGLVGGQFWSVYVDCDPSQNHFEDPSVCQSLCLE